VGQLPPAEYWRDGSGEIPVPKDARNRGTYHTANEFGQYRYAWYICSGEDAAGPVVGPKAQ
jgi:hypothetical protein